MSKPLRLNGFTAGSLGRARLPFRGACSPPCTFLISLMTEGAVASLPARGSPCSSPWRLHPNGTNSRDSRNGVPKLSRRDSRNLNHHNSRLQSPIATRSDQSCSPRRDLFNAMSHAQIGCREEVDSRLLVVGSQTASLTPGPFFAHNLGCRCPNDQCEAIFDIYVSRPFQRHQEHPNARCFAPCCRALNIRESRKTPNPQLFQVLGFTPTLGQVRVATFTSLRAKYIVATFNANIRKAIHIITLCKPSTLSLSMFISHL